MKCCAFGTVRVDIRAYQDIHEIDQHEEIKISEMAMTVGGSVYNTVSVLNELKHDAVLYMLNAYGDFADYVRIKLNNRNLNYISCKEDKNDTATSIIFVDKMGKKKMVSYDGIRQDRYILNKLKEDIDQYQLFYTSFYEINQNNYETLVDIMSSCAKNFIDLSPLIYEVDSNVIHTVLKEVYILSGTDDEYGILLKILDMESYHDLIHTYGITYVFVKRGSEGASLYTENSTYHFGPDEKRVSHDTTGCGDTFNAGVISALAKDMNDEMVLQKAVKMATKVAYEGFNLDIFGEA